MKKNNNIVTMPKDLKGKTVLVVDDNIMNIMIANIILKKYDVVVSEASNGEEAVNYLKNNECDLILMDLQMPVINGYEASEIIRQKLRLNLPIIALTASNTEEEREKCFEVGMNDYLAKPFSEEQLLQTICVWIGKPEDFII
ncbi:response regulator [Polaribacter sp.]|jgi:CheY-like chemotaxis protein|uniref:response regulator n=1 Tax=Polaribacter sp. TaxID=1920175 RepID=UPI003ABED5D7